jgi:formylglycine-generating enzyme required for sulfatase activity/serine/threonine protein kinase
MSQESNTLPVGYQLEEYRIDSILGTGGFGITYKAQDTHLETWVAIKEYFPIEWSYRGRDGISVHANTQGQELIADVQSSGYEWGLDRFLNEARVLASIHHDYVVRVRRYFRAHGTAYIVMDYEEGEPLSALLRREKTLSEADLRGLLEEVLPALEAVHQKGYLHRDLKPSNLYVRARDGCVMLIDFGAARQSLGRHSKSITGLVTPGYSPPEQYVTRSDRYGPWTDIYALGAVLYRCLTGKPPIEAPDRQMWDSMIPAVEAGAGRYGVDLLTVVDRALAMRPEDRFQSVAEMQAALITPTHLDMPSRFTLVPKQSANEKTVPANQVAAAQPLEELFDLSTPPISRPSQKIPEPSVSLTLHPVAESLDKEELHATEVLSLPSLSRFDSTPASSGSAAESSRSLRVSEVIPAKLSLQQEVSQVVPISSTVEGASSAPLKFTSQHPNLAQSMRLKPAASSTPAGSLPERPEAAEHPAKGSRIQLVLVIVFIGLGCFWLYKGFQDKVNALLQEQQEAESHRLEAVEQMKGEEEARHLEMQSQLEQANKAIVLKDWVQANVHLDRAELLQPGSLKVAELRAQLREEQLKLGSLEVQVEPITAMKLVKINQGCFLMGTPENQPERYANESPHQVCVDDFWISQSEVTNAQFRQFKPAHDSGSFRGMTLNGDQQPAVNVSWQEATAFADWLSQRTGKRFRLPTEAEWEYAARATRMTIRFWGDNPADACLYANVADETAQRIWGAENIHHCDDGQAVTAPVGAFLANAFKLQDTLGNVSEWTCSEYQENSYEVEPGRCPGQREDKGYRVVRGGSWDDPPKLVRSADRNYRDSVAKDNDLGFRLVQQQ